MSDILFIANNNLGQGLSGGDTIFLNFIKYWRPRFSQISILASEETISLLRSNHLTSKIRIFKSDNASPFTKLNLTDLIFHQFRRIFFGLNSLSRLNNYFDYVYTTSDFLPDLLPGIIYKLLHPKTILLSGFYLIVPSPFNPNTPYKSQFFKNLCYYLIQRLSLFLVNLFADYVFITSDPDKKYFSKSDSHIIIVRGGVTQSTDPQALTDYRHRPYQALFMGRLHPQKGVLQLVNIWRLVVNHLPQAKLALIGDGELLPLLQQKIKELKLDRNISLMGFLSGKPKYEVFKDSAIVLHPAIFDSGGMAAAEAMAFGLPGISFDLEALKTYYPQGMIKIKCYDLNLFADEFIRLYQNPKKYHHLSKDAYQLIQNHWLWPKRSLEVLNQLLNP